MQHFVHILALVVLGAEDTRDAKMPLKAAVEKVLNEATTNEAVQNSDPASPQGVTVVHDEGATTVTLQNAQISLSNRVQFRFMEELPSSGVQLPGTTRDGQSKGSFRIRRAKTALEGWFWKKELTFDVQLSWAGPEAGASTQTPLEDARLTWDASKKGSFLISIGQFKVPFGRQEMTSSGRLQFADRSLLNGEFTRGRDVGVQVHGRIAKDRVEYFAGVFNGNPASRISNDNTKLQYNARVSVEPLGRVSYSEGAFEGWDKPLLALAVQFENNDLSGATNLTDLNTTVFGGDLVFKHKGFSIFAEYFNRKRTPEAVSGPSSATSGAAALSGGSFQSNGYNLQAGYFLKRDKLEIAARIAGYDPSNKLGANSQSEKGGALTYFILKHTLKVTADFRALRDDFDRTTNKELRLQTQVTF
jgi:phosphate-selective porin OprO/OprP